MGIMRRIKGIILPGLANAGGGAGKNMNEMVMEELVYAFRESITRMSTRKSLICHTAYVVYVPMRYYKELLTVFGILTKDAVDTFHEELLDRLKKNRSLKFETASESWSFDLHGLGEDTQDTPDEENPDSTVTYEDLEENFVAVRSFVLSNEMYDFSACSEDEVVKTNRSQPNSTFNKMQRLSVRAIIGLRPNGTGYSYPITLAGGSSAAGGNAAGGSVPGSAASVGDRVLAVLESAEEGVHFTDAMGRTFKAIDISLPDFYIGGSSARSAYQGKPMLKLDSEAVQSPHLHIRQDEQGDFYICPIGPVEQGGIVMAKNRWTRLANKHASIKINGNIELTFNKK